MRALLVVQSLQAGLESSLLDPTTLPSSFRQTIMSQDLVHLQSFLSGSSGHTMSPLQEHLLNGWKQTTLLSYNSAVKRFLQFYENTRKTPFILPATEDDIYDFCLSISRTRSNQTDNRVTSKTTAKYLYALQAWHLFHQQPYPKSSQNVVAILLRASAHADASVPTKPKKPAVMVYHLLALFDTLNGGTPRDEAILDCVICAFWGMARLAELTYASPDGKPDRRNAVLCGDALRPVDDLSHVYLSVRGAKKAKPGVAQPILLIRQPNKLCPVEAILRRLKTTVCSDDSLFGYLTDEGIRKNLTRSVVVSRCRQVWHNFGWDSISGHSFRVGGASLRAALGVDHIDIKKLGRWTSDCYKLYIRDYSNEEMTKTLSILKALNTGTN